jgi:precorrin-6B C5,15-methyltransferase / cobalt-precorrin-6B C5,C15-methyltransferase
MRHEPIDALCWLIGVLDNGPADLTAEATDRIRAAHRVIGGTRVLELCNSLIGPEAERLDLTARITQVPNWIQETLDAGRSAVVLATGDPLCFGIGGLVAKHVPAKRLRVLPNLSTLQLACARFLLPWSQAQWLSAHAADSGDWHPGSDPGHGLYDLVQSLAQPPRGTELFGVLTSPANDPSRIARLLLAEDLDGDYEMRVAERLLQPGERLIQDAPAKALAGMRFADPNLVLLSRRADAAPQRHPLIGLPDSTYQQRRPDKGLITKREVRAAALALLELRPTDRVWDVGAGSGSVGLEAARLCPSGHVWAIEKNGADLTLIEQNRRRLGVTNYSARAGLAPSGCADWPDPDAVFVGGSGGQLESIIETALVRLRADGRLVVALVAIENLGRTLATLDARGLSWELTQIQAARSQPILDMHRLQAENPVWLVQVRQAAGRARTNPEHDEPTPSSE